MATGHGRPINEVGAFYVPAVLSDGIDYTTVLRNPVISNALTNRPFFASLLTALGTVAVLTTVFTPPISQKDWPIVNRRIPVADQLGFVSSNSSLFYGTAFSQNDWPIVNRKISVADQLGFINSNSSLFYGAAFSQTDWPVVTNRKNTIAPGFVNSNTPLLYSVAAPFSQGYWPNPSRPQGQLVDLGFISFTTVFDPSLYVPFNQGDWPVTGRAKSVPDQFGFTASSSWLASPFSQGNWPTPPGRFKSIPDQFGFVASSSSWLAAPFSQGDWQNPSRLKPINNFDRSVPYNVNLYSITFVAVPFVQGDWPNPKGPRALIADQLGYVDPSEFQLLRDTFFGAAGMGPSYDWPNPQRIKQRSEYGFTDSYKVLLFAAPPSPFYITDWPNPKGPKALVADQLGYIDPSEFQMLRDTFFGAAGMGPSYDWPNPSRVKPRSEYGSTDSYKVLLFAAPPSPFYLTDWQNPRGPKALIADQLGYIDPSEFQLLRDTFFGPAGMGPTYDWPNPLRVKPRSEYGSTDFYKVLLFAAPPSPFYLTDWQNPRGPKALIGDQLGYLDPTEYWLLNHVLPTVSRFDWTNPVIAKTASAQYAGHFEAYKINLYSLVFTPFTQIDWPNPQLLKPINNLDRSVPYNIGLAISFAPFLQTDWPNPARLKIVNSLDRSVLYNTNLFSIPYPFTQTDWANPKGAAPRTDLFGFIPAYNVQLQQRPFIQTSWPVPRGVIIAANHYRYFDYYRINLFTQPLRQTDWPNPLLRQPGTVGNYNWTARAQLIPGNFQVPGAGQLLLTTYQPMLTLDSQHHWRRVVTLRGDNVIGNSILGNIDTKRNLDGE